MTAQVGLPFRLWRLAITAAALTLGACSATLPGPGDLAGDASRPKGQAGLAAASGTAVGPVPPLATAKASGAPGATTAGAPTSGQSTEVARGGFIQHLRSASVVLFLSETGHDGVRVPSSSLALPLLIEQRSADGYRVQVMTVEGARWIPVADLSTAPAASTRAALGNPTAATKR